MNQVEKDKTQKINPTLKLDSITHRYGELDILNQFNYEFKSGKLYAFMGASGSGKSTLLHIASGLLTPSVCGDVIYNNQIVTGTTINENSYIFADSFLIPELTCFENIKVFITEAILEYLMVEY